MSESRFEVELRGFSEQVRDPVDALMRGFGVSAARAESILDRLPAVVKRRAVYRDALDYARALTKLGGLIEVRDESSGAAVTLDELAGFDSTPASLIESADPLARRGAVPRAAFRSGSHPSLSFPKTAAGVAVTPTSLTALKGDEAEREAVSPPDGPAQGPSQAVSWPAAGPPLAEGARSGSLAAAPGEPVEALELDEASIPAGRSGAAVPAMPEVLAQIRDFEATGWEPLRPEIGLGFATPQPSVPARSSTGAPGRAAPAEALSKPLSRRPPSLPKRPSGRPSNRNPVVVAVVVALAVVAGVLVATKFLGGVSDELRQSLENHGRLYVPSLEMKEVVGGSIDGQRSEENPVSVRLGACYGWIATTADPGCDLDLYLSTAVGEPIVEDSLLDNVPVVFHCPEDDAELRLRIANAGSAECAYGLARFEGRGSVGWPLEPYLRLYLDLLSATLGGEFEPVDEIRRGSLSFGETERFDLFIPAGSCYHVLAVVQQGSDLDMTMSVDGREVSSDQALDSFPFVGFCADREDAFALVEILMYSGSGNYVRQTYQGVP